MMGIAKPSDIEWLAVVVVVSMGALDAADFAWLAGKAPELQRAANLSMRGYFDFVVSVIAWSAVPSVAVSSENLTAADFALWHWRPPRSMGGHYFTNCEASSGNLHRW